MRQLLLVAGIVGALFFAPAVVALVGGTLGVVLAFVIAVAAIGTAFLLR